MKAVVDDRKKAGDNPYPHKFEVTQMFLGDLIWKHYDKLDKGDIRMDFEISLAGRIMKSSKHGKLVIYQMDVDGKKFHLVDDSR
ncbi:hypothetical protein OROMI_023335 [Orobanche minor]